MITDEEVDAHLAMLKDFGRRMKEDLIELYTAAYESATSDFMRQFWLKDLKEIKAMGTE